VAVTIKATVRETGKHSTLTNLRDTGQIPGTYYGKKIDPVTISLDAEDLHEALATGSGSNVMVDLVLEAPAGTTATLPTGKQVAMIKDMQKNPITGQVLHIDLVKVSMSEEIHATIPLIVSGDSPGVKVGGVLQHSIREINVKCLPAAMPEQFELDVSALEIGDSIHLRDINPPAGVEILDDPDEILVSIVPPAKEEEVAPVEEGAEEAEPEVIGEKKEEEEAGE
jgi:large subunit ribosomal protein L25